MLVRILNAIANHFTELGYVQGMNFIAASLLLILCSEEDTFYMLCQLLDTYDLKGMYLNRFYRMKVLCFQLESFTQAYLPHINDLLARECVDSEYYATRWFLTLFSYDLSIECITTVLDLFMVEGFKCLIKVAMAFLSHAYSQYLRDRHARLIDIVKHDEHRMESRALLKMAQSFKVTTKLMNDMEELQKRESTRPSGIKSRMLMIAMNKD